MIKKMLKKALAWLPGKYILFESVPDVSDNTKAVFDEMIRQGYNNKYKLVWLCAEPVRDYPRIRNVVYFSINGTTLGKLQFSYYLIRTKLVICCNRLYLSTNPKAIIIYLHHGTPIKDTTKYFCIAPSINYVLAASKKAAEIVAKQLKVPSQKMVVLGYPRNDDLVMRKIDIHSLFPDHCFNKVVVWYPTFRKSLSSAGSGSIHSLPLLWDLNNIFMLNEFAKNERILVVIKLHFAQDDSLVQKKNLSHILFIDDDFFFKHDISSYCFVGNCDALLTDYSSIYYDYTLCDKPIGLIWEDYKEYKRNPGFIDDMSEVMKGGVKIFSFDDLKSFLANLTKEKDSLRKERREIRDIFNYSTDGKNAYRVVKFLADKAGL